MKLKSIEEVSKAVKPGTAAGGDDFLSRVNSTIKNFQQLVEMANQFKGQARPAPQEAVIGKDVAVRQQPGPGVNQNSLIKFFDIIITQGFGDATIGEVLTKLSPVTMKQAREFFKNAKFGE